MRIHTGLVLSSPVQVYNERRVTSLECRGRGDRLQSRWWALVVGLSGARRGRCQRCYISALLASRLRVCHGGAGAAAVAFVLKLWGRGTAGCAGRYEAVSTTPVARVPNDSRLLTVSDDG